MLIELTVKNMAVIKHVTIPFGKGLHVLTGETGAGKSILIDALSLLLGARSSADYVRHGMKKAEIEGIFEVDADHPAAGIMRELGLPLEEDGTVIIRREISRQGKSISRVNGQAITLTMLRQIGPWLIQMHGQHEHQALLDSNRHLHWLDTYGEQEIGGTKREYQALYRKYREMKSELAQLTHNDRAIAQRIDLLQFQLQEIVEAELSPGEDEELFSERQKMANAENLHENIETAYNALQGEQRGLDWVAHAVGLLESSVKYDGKLNESVEMLHTALIQLEEVIRTLRDYRYGLEFDPVRLNQVEARLNELSRLKRKYGKDVDEILEYAAGVEDELDQLTNRDKRSQELEQQLLELVMDLAVEADELSKVRRRVAEPLAKAIEQEIRELQMGQARFEIALKRKEDSAGIDLGDTKVKVTTEGVDEVEFRIAPNPGEPARSVAKIASGGELSRIMLAIKTILAHIERIDTLIFDEVDTGVSGRAAQAIAEKLAKVGANSQVLCITHLPQVASMADRHYYIQKQTDGSETETQVNLLDEEGKIMELSRMLGGAELTQVTAKHAKEMIELAATLKQKIS